MLGYKGMEYRAYSLSLTLFICFFPITGTASESDKFSCGPGVKSDGITVPKGDIILKNGQPLEIFCMFDPDKKINISSLAFYKNEVEVSKELVSVVNETTIRLYNKTPLVSDSIYYCKLKTPEGSTGICLNHVYVGYPPLPVKNFFCISYNWENMNCSWTPDLNPVRPTYNLSYYETNSTNSRMQFHCPENHSQSNYCIWTPQTVPLYRSALEYYYFSMYIKNDLGENITRYKVNHFAIVVPSQAEALSLVEATPNSLDISWKHPANLMAFPPGLVAKVMYQSENDKDDSAWKLVDTSNVTLNKDTFKYTLNVTGLKYAHTLYDIRVYLRSAFAKDEPIWWSKPASITLRTKATVPGMSPKTNIGSFETAIVGNGRDIIIYWQQIPKNMENGDSFGYQIIKVEEYFGNDIIERNIVPNEKTKTYAKFINMTNNAYKFSIVSSNKEGYSSDVSVVKVPARINKLGEPKSFTKFAHFKGLFELSWQPPNDNSVTNYTIFWCENKQDRPFDCKGLLNWITVTNDTGKNITLPEGNIYQFAISANSLSSSSGMLWAKCTVLPDARQKLGNTWINRIGSTFIEINWKLACFEMVKIRGFVISFCPILNPKNQNCKEPMQNKTIPNVVDKANITGLKPYTTYKVQIAIETNAWLGEYSDPLFNTTLEDAPDMGPINVTIVKVTNTSITLQWSPPVSLNGVLRYYQIFWNNNMTRVENKLNIVQFMVTDLESYEDYNISISACTVACSSNTSVGLIRTKIGRPSQLAVPEFKNNTAGTIIIKWNSPKKPGGFVNYYKIKIEESNDGKIYHEKGIKTNETSYEAKIEDCKTSSTNFYKIYVKAVNVDNSTNETYEGIWSLPAPYSCRNSSQFNFTTKIFIVVLALVLLAIVCSAFGYIMKCAWLRFKAMQNVGVKLPPQLELNNVFKDKQVSDLPISSHICPSSLKSHHCPTELLDENTTPDQQLLLSDNKKDEGSCDSPCDELDMVLDNSSGGHVESSGCGSGHDSVSSSITAGTHITDSGTEADERPASPDVFSQSPRRLSDLRQRNITGSGSGGGGNGSGEGYSRLAAAPTGYVTLPQGPRTYVSHAHLWPHNGAVQQCHKGYVMPPQLSSTYSKVSLLPSAGLKVNSSREQGGADSENSTRSDGQLSINPASSI